MRVTAVLGSVAVPTRRLLDTGVRSLCDGSGRTCCLYVSNPGDQNDRWRSLAYPLQLSHLNGRKSSWWQKGI